MTRASWRYGLLLSGALLGSALLWPGNSHRQSPAASAGVNAPLAGRANGGVVRDRNELDKAKAAPDTSVAGVGSAAIAPSPVTPSNGTSARPEAEVTGESCSQARRLVLPSGSPSHLACSEARTIISEVHTRYAGPTQLDDVHEFSRLVAGWLDPHGLWSAAPDSPVARALEQRAAALLDEIRQEPSSNEPCAAALALGADLAKWVTELGRLYDRAVLVTPRRGPARDRALASARLPAFQDDPVTEPARSLSRRLGERIGRFKAAFPELSDKLVETARARYFPPLSAEGFAEVVLAAAVRAYVPSLDPHGDWAPFEEEWSLYAGDPGLDGEPRLWNEITRTALGVRVVGGAPEPLATGDLILSIDGVLLAGMPLEQAEQLGRLEPPNGKSRHVNVLRRTGQFQELEVAFDDSGDPAEAAVPLETERVRYGDGSALVVRLSEVADGVGEALGRVLAEARHSDVSGVVLDLRGNGGGSTDAAASVIGLFLPGAPLFPLASRGKLLEVMQALEPAKDERWDGPVAALVDGYTASAAEMIAGALSSYERGKVVGGRTFGKGCIQEYADDHIRKGVLRVTTLLFALPDGTPIQRTGLAPDLLVPTRKAREHEADLIRTLPAYRGPDVRDRTLVSSRPWPSAHGRVGPCSDHLVCATLSRLGVSQVASRAAASRRTSPRALSGSAPR
ncbi:MAG TPA: S41 family peptidase [Polyangiaceae bacterium]|nr:S41 family peptidase [Polyangiaceae bacterium]